MYLLTAIDMKGISELCVSPVSRVRGETPLTRKGPPGDCRRRDRGIMLQDITLIGGIRAQQEFISANLNGPKQWTRVEIMLC